MEPGDRAPAPGDLALLQAFVNTNDIEQGTDRLRDPRLLGAWLRERGIGGVQALTDLEWRRAIEVREGLRALAAANNEAPFDAPAVSLLQRAAQELRLVPDLGIGSRWELQPGGIGVDGFLERVLAIAIAAMSDGRWERMKSCQSDSCRWLFYDHSRNRSSVWCTMAICGARAKARSYRARQLRGPRRTP